jgi:hypothetical protein
MPDEFVRKIVRECGDCYECCVRVPVHAFNKPKDKGCEYLNIIQPCGACGIYSERPSECKTYTCSWLEGRVPVELRPKESGILLESARFDWNGRRIYILLGFVYQPGAITRYRKQLEAAAVNGVVIGLADEATGETQICGESEDVEAYEQFMAKVRADGHITHVMADKTWTEAI